MRGANLLAVLIGAAALAGCADDSSTTQPTDQAAAKPVQVAPALKPTTAPPAGALSWDSGGPAPTPGADQSAQVTPDGKPKLTNDPSAPTNTALCGSQAREINAMGAAVDPEAAGAAGTCATYACYDPLTATYIGADGNRHVCRVTS